MSQLVVLPILLPLGTAILLIVVRHLLAQRVLSVLSVAAGLSLSLTLLVTVWRDGILVYQQGDWVAPFGITLVGDLLSAGMVSVTMTIGLAALVFSIASLDRERESFLFHPLFHFQLVGVNGAILTGDIFNLFVFVEVMLIASYALISLGGTAQQLEATIKYVSLNLLSSTMLVGTVGLLYGLMGTLNMADLSVRISASSNQGLVTPLATMFIVVFGIKAALFALWFWMPGTYTVVPAGISAYFGGVLTKVGIYFLLRTFTLIFSYDPSFLHMTILALAGPTMFFGVLGAAAQREYRTILTWHISSQTGYMIMGLGFFTVGGVAAAIFFTIHNVLTKSTLFLTSGMAERLSGSRDIYKMGGLLALSPITAILFLIAALSLAGVPPLPGFWGKLMFVRAAVDSGSWLNLLVVAVSLVVSLLTLFSMLKIWQTAYWRHTPPDAKRVPVWGMAIPTLMMVGLIVALGVYPRLLADFSQAAAEQIMSPHLYVEAVLRTAGVAAAGGGG